MPQTSDRASELSKPNKKPAVGLYHILLPAGKKNRSNRTKSEEHKLYYHEMTNGEVMTLITKSGIRVDSYVQRADGTLVNFDDLKGEERVRAATELKSKWLNGLFMGIATFTPDYSALEKKGEAGAGG